MRGASGPGCAGSSTLRATAYAATWHCDNFDGLCNCCVVKRRRYRSPARAPMEPGNDAESETDRKYTSVLQCVPFRVTTTNALGFLEPGPPTGTPPPGHGSLADGYRSSRRGSGTLPPSS